MDKEYVVNYPVNMLNIDRSNQGSISISTSVLGSSDDEGGDSITLGSTNAINSSYDGNIWSAIESGVRSILIEGVTTTANTDQGEDGSASNSNFISVNR